MRRRLPAKRHRCRVPFGPNRRGSKHLLVKLADSMSWRSEREKLRRVAVKEEPSNRMHNASFRRSRERKGKSTRQHEQLYCLELTWNSFFFLLGPKLRTKEGDPA